MVRDPVQDKLKDIIAGKRKAGSKPRRKPTKTTTGETPTNVVNIMDALRKSIAARRRAVDRLPCPVRPGCGG